MLKGYNVYLESDTLSLIKTDNLSELVRRLLKEYADKQKKDQAPKEKSWEHYAVEESEKLRKEEARQNFIFKRKALEDKYEEIRKSRLLIMDADPTKALELHNELKEVKKQLDEMDANA